MVELMCFAVSAVELPSKTCSMARFLSVRFGTGKSLQRIDTVKLNKREEILQPPILLSKFSKSESCIKASWKKMKYS